MKNMKNLIQESMPILLCVAAMVALGLIMGRIYFLF